MKKQQRKTHGLFLFGSSNLKIVLSFTTVLNACQLTENIQNNVIMKAWIWLKIETDSRETKNWKPLTSRLFVKDNTNCQNDFIRYLTFWKLITLPPWNMQWIWRRTSMFLLLLLLLLFFCFFFGPEHNLSRCYSKIAVHWFIHVLTAATCFSDNNVCSTHWGDM